MKTTYLFILFVLLFALAHAQSGIKKESYNNKTIYGEFGGPGLFLSANFDTRFTRKPTGLGLRAGFGFAPTLSGSAISVPLGINFLAGKNKHYFEVEGGTSYVHLFESTGDGWWSTGPSSEWIKYLYAGYRYKSQDGFTFRIGFCPLFGEGEAMPWVGISVGGSF